MILRAPICQSLDDDDDAANTRSPFTSITMHPMHTAHIHKPGHNMMLHAKFIID